MSDLTLAASFPTGYFLAHDGRGDPEWPPAPARLLSAILATAYRRRDAKEVVLARRLFDLPPPTLWLPPHGLRDTDVQRWVPVPVEYDEATRRFGRGGPGARLLKGPERGVHVGEGIVVVRFPAAPYGPEELALLDGLLRDVAYLGRPTSPVVVERLPGGPGPDPDGEMWAPDERGRHRLPIATADLLAALDLRERRRADSPPGAHPEHARRPTAAYRVTGSPQWPHVIPASPATVERELERLVYYRTPRARPHDLSGVVDALGVGGDGLLVPDIGVESRRGIEVPRLFGVACAAATPGLDGELVCLLGGEVAHLTPSTAPRHAGRPSRFERLVGRTWGRARAWTTTCPPRLVPGQVTAHLHRLATDRAAVALEAQTHGPGRIPGSPDVAYHPTLRHVTVLFDRAVDGPLTLDGVALAPIALPE